MPIFNGSLVDELLNELSSRLAAVPELIETYDLDDVRFQLSVLVVTLVGCTISVTFILNLYL